jgi:hypothetical protein
VKSRILATAVLLAAVSTPLAPALEAHAPHATRVEVQDPREGRSLLDLREVDSAVKAGALTFSVLTWSRWRTEAIEGRGFVVVHLDPRDGRRYYALVRSRSSRVEAILFRKRGGKRDTRAATLRAWRADHRSLSLRIPLGALSLTRIGQPYSWRVQTLFTSRRCGWVCFDNAPDRGDTVEALPPAPG